MGLKDIEGTPTYEAAKNMYGFNMAADATIEERVMEAAARIYESGVRVVEGRVMAGHNNVRADFAAAAFDRDELKAAQKTAFEKGDDMMAAVFGVVLERQYYMEDEAQPHLDRIAQTGSILETMQVFKNRAPAA